MDERDERIRALLLAGEQRGMELLLARYGGLLRYVISGVLGSGPETEDCYSEVSLSVWQRFSAFDPQKGTLSTWLTALARNAACTRLRAQRRRAEHFSEEKPLAPSAEEEALRRENAARLEGALRSLSAGDRQLFYRKYYYLQSTARIAAELGTTERAVEGRLYRLKKRLREAMGGDDR